MVSKHFVFKYCLRVVFYNITNYNESLIIEIVNVSKKNEGTGCLDENHSSP
jgi:hypothetical protein